MQKYSHPNKACIFYKSRQLAGRIINNYTLAIHPILFLMGSIPVKTIRRDSSSIRPLHPFHTFKIVIRYEFKGLFVLADKLHLLPTLLAFENVICLIQYRTKVFYKLLKPCLDLFRSRKDFFGETFSLLLVRKDNGDCVSYVPLPRFLLQDEAMRGISNDAKVLYALLLDRASISRQNGYVEPDGTIRLYFTLEQAQTKLHRSRQSATRIFRELEYSGLIVRRKQGLGKPALITLNYPADAKLIQPREDGAISHK